jgi:transcriptional regulator with XRE-family HTH domain
MKNRIKELREAKGINGARLAKICGFSQPMMSRFERGVSELTLDQAQTIADVLEVELVDLICNRKAISINAVPGELTIEAKLRTRRDAEWLIARIQELSGSLLNDSKPLKSNQLSENIEHNPPIRIVVANSGA